MKETKKVSISGVAFVFDIDAFEVLESYLEHLNRTYGDDGDGKEIVADIEARIAELILSHQDNTTVVSRPLIRSIIDQMGSPEDIENESGDTRHTDTPRIPRRLYRNSDGAKLGGVCAGLGKFFDIDPAWIRLAMFIPIFFAIIGPFSWIRSISGELFGFIVLLYILMWFAIPMAKTARQKLEMEGESINASTISKATRAAGETPRDEQNRSLIADIVYICGRLFLFLLKAFAIMLLLGLIAGVIACIISLFGLIFFSSESDFDAINSWTTYLQPAVTYILVISAVIGIVLPFILLSYLLAGFIFGFRINRAFPTVLSLVWIAIVAVFMTTAISYRHEIRHGINNVNMRSSIERALARWNINEAILNDLDLDEATVRVYGRTYNVGTDRENIIEITHDGILIDLPEKDIHIDIDNEDCSSDDVEEGVTEVVKAVTEPAADPVSTKKSAVLTIKANEEKDGVTVKASVKTSEQPAGESETVEAVKDATAITH